MKEYVAGLLFSTDFSNIAVVLKNRPDWQAGKFNAIGGKIEPGETPSQAIEREFFEETGLRVPESSWQHTVELGGDGWRCYFYRTFGDPRQCRTMEDETIHILPISEVLLANLVPNFRWILTLNMSQDIIFPISIKHISAISEQLQ
jgi:8-oxo-dGTP diphosphatase